MVDVKAFAFVHSFIHSCLTVAGLFVFHTGSIIVQTVRRQSHHINTGSPNVDGKKTRQAVMKMIQKTVAQSQKLQQTAVNCQMRMLKKINRSITASTVTSTLISTTGDIGRKVKSIQVSNEHETDSMLVLLRHQAVQVHVCKTSMMSIILTVAVFSQVLWVM